MTPAQEAKLDLVLQAVSAQNAKIENHEKVIDDHKSQIEDLQAHKNKTVGIAAFISLIFTTLGAALLALFKS